ncbi:MAG: ChaN family lipoprotein [Planctomycetota bacterium]
MLAGLVVLAACTTTHLPPAGSPRQGKPWAAPPLDRAVVVRDTRTGADISFARLLDALAEADAVFLGEVHTDETTHRVELGVYEGLLERRPGDVVLALEMFERDVQPALDAYLAGTSSESEFLAAARPWANYATAYRPMIEAARSRRLPVVASNFPTPLRRVLARSAGSTLDTLSGADRAHAPRELLPSTPAYWQRVDNAVRGHAGMTGAAPEDANARLYSTQSLWDNSMGEACALALDRHPGSLVLHVNGGFHSAHWDGTVRQFALRRPTAKVLTVAIVPTANPATVDPEGKPEADYVVHAEARATDLNEGTHSVYATREVRYRLHLPGGEPGERGWPLLVWFADDGMAAQDGLALWRRRFGAECAIAVIEAPYIETQDDLGEGGRWFWPDTFAADVQLLVGVADETWAFLLRHHRIDPGRVCVAGEGTGATVAAAVSLLSRRMGARGVAVAPRRYSKLTDVRPPLTEDRSHDPGAGRSLRVLLESDDEAWWAKELADYESAGLETDLQVMTSDPWRAEVERETALRAGLGLEPMSPASGARRHILAASPRARMWARLAALEQRAAGQLVAVLDAPPTDSDSVAIDTSVRAAAYAAGVGIPRCPGPFGGTTVVVLPAATPTEEIEAWLAIEKNDPVTKKDRFSRLRVATATGERSLPEVLGRLHREGRRNVLVVPATFAADEESMRALRRSVRAWEDRSSLRWLPGLGAPAR